ncbi:DUF1707 SHOCT-like domain-containing protein [Solirubrobacter soli]|uniref:DUF1707 SHOCT-like domain-containing protein n=1 Tax=Solirubrobacter soli TaxID=363832 RepID=UPI00069F22FA|nr:DUF1707 domain-containing protein [Solirubrobacter soli]
MEIRASDAERDATVDRLREAAAEGRLTLEELSDRVETAAGAVMRSELDALTRDLPARSLAPVQAQAPDVRALGDIKRSGSWLIPAENHFRTFFGTIKLDLRQAQISANETRIHAWTLFGNVDLLVPEGVEVEIQTKTPIGRLRHEAAPPVAGAPRIVLTGGTFFGDVRIRHRRLWEKLVGR